MYETEEEVHRLRVVLDRSYADAGPHLLSIHTDNWRVGAEQLIDLLQGMCVLNLATVNSRCEPIQGPVDGMFYKGRFWFGSSPDSVRARHLRARPAVSAAHVRGEELAVVVHGMALLVDKQSERGHGFRAYAAEIYGTDTVDVYWEGTAPYWEIEPRKMFALAPQI